MKKIITSRLYIILVVLLIVVTTIPYMYGFFTAEEGLSYSGIHRLTAGDTNTYYAMIEQAKDGKLAFVNLFTSEEHPRIFVNGIWLIAGWIAKVVGSGPIFAYHALRVLLIPVFVLLMFRLVTYVFPERRRTQTIALLLLLFSSGLGVFFNPFLYDPNDLLEHSIDVWVPESITFLTLYHSPHFIASAGLLVATLYFTLRAFRERSKKYIFWAGGTSLVLYFIHPFYVATIFTVALVWLFIELVIHRKKAVPLIWHYGLLLLAAIPAGIYFFWLQNQTIVYEAWATQNVLRSPSPLMYIIGFGLLLPFFVYACFRFLPNPVHRYLIFWAGVVGLLLYAPIDFQRRLVEGLHVPISLLAAPIMVMVYDWLKQKKEFLATAFGMFFALFLPLTNVQQVLQDVYLYATDKDYPFYIPRDEKAAFDWIKENTNEEAVIFSSSYAGNFVPVYTHRRAFVAHSPQTVFYREKLLDLHRFFDPQIDEEWKHAYLLQWDVTHVYYGENERDLGEYNPHDASFLDKAYSSGDVSVFTVKTE